MALSQDTIQFVFAMVVATTLMYISYLSTLADYKLGWATVVGLLALFTLLLFGPTKLAELIEAWRGGGGL